MMRKHLLFVALLLAGGSLTASPAAAVLFFAALWLWGGAALPSALAPEISRQAAEERDRLKQLWYECYIAPALEPAKHFAALRGSAEAELQRTREHWDARRHEFQIHTPDASIYILEPGLFRIGRSAKGSCDSFMTAAGGAKASRGTRCRRGAMHCACSAGFGLHLADQHGLIKNIFAAFGRPLIDNFTHRGRGRNRIKCCYFAQCV